MAKQPVAPKRGVGRPKTRVDLKRRERVVVFFTFAEAELVRAAAGGLGSVSTKARDVLLAWAGGK